MWSAEVDASLYSTPRLFDLNGDGVKDVISQVHDPLHQRCCALSRVALQAFVRHLEVFDGAEGHPLPGFPFTLPASTSHSTPLIHDILGDGNPHIGVVT
jgi:hypothetical protein